jgi:alpha-tubulin suppressor-like RCC1 family protein
LSSVNLKLAFNISKKVKLLKIACGGTHSLALTNSGDILSWGYGKLVSKYKYYKFFSFFFYILLLLNNKHKIFNSISIYLYIYTIIT